MGFRNPRDGGRATNGEWEVGLRPEREPGRSPSLILESCRDGDTELKKAPCMGLII